MWEMIVCCTCTFHVSFCIYLSSVFQHLIELVVIYESSLSPSYHYYNPRNEVVGGYTGFTMSVRLSVRPSVLPSVEKSYVVR